MVSGPKAGTDRPTRTLPVAGPSITDHEIELVTEAVRTAWYESANDVTERFEREFASRVGRIHAVSLPSCTSALHLTLAALGVGVGDEVIVPDATWIATSAPVPIATPTSACAKAGASLTPSPAMATLRPSRCNSAMI